MVKKLAELAEEGGESTFVSTIRESAATIWLAGLGAFSKAQEEGGKLFDTLVKEGEAVQNRASKSAQETLSEARSRASETWDKLEHVFVDRVGRALHSLNVPTKHDIDTLTKRVSELSKVADKLAAAMKEAQAKPKVQHAEAPSAKKTAPKTQARAHP
jgi:poly(hydroxyalkanoate) granule-associated protein